MDEPINGQPEGVDIPAIMVGWDAEKQTVVLGIDSTQFKTWDFVIACLQMAQAQAESNRRIQQVQHMQNNQVAQQQSAAILRKLGR